MAMVIEDVWSETTAEARENVPTVALWPISVDQYHQMAQHKILLDGDPVELLDGILCRKNATTRVPQLDRLSTWCQVVLSPRQTDLMPVWRLSVDQYHEMAKVGILKFGDPVELIDGLLVRKMTRNTPHSFASYRLRIWTERLLLSGYHLRVQEPISCDWSEPEPDQVITRGGEADYLERHPAPVETPIIFEVSEASLSGDKSAKLSIYARNQIREYWIVNLIDRCVEVFTEPSGPVETPHYKTQRIYRPGESVPLVIDGTTCGNIEVSEVLPPVG
jgi:hypothetical protein